MARSVKRYKVTFLATGETQEVEGTDVADAAKKIWPSVRGKVQFHTTASITNTFQAPVRIFRNDQTKEEIRVEQI